MNPPVEARQRALISALQMAAAMRPLHDLRRATGSSTGCFATEDAASSAFSSRPIKMKYR